MKNYSLLKKMGLAIAISLLTLKIAQAAVFQIQGVAGWDSLNVRSGPGASNQVVVKIPANGKNIRSSGQRKAIGNTVWVKVSWQGKTGWVSERYIRPMQTAQAPQPQVSTTVQASSQTNSPMRVQRTAPVEGSKGKWVLECGNMSPFWKVIVHPKALDVNLRGQSAGMIPITYEKQDRNRWNTAMKTVLRSSNGRNQTNMEIRYTKQCFHTLAKQNVHYWVKAKINNEQLKGCCRAIRIQ